MQKYVTLDADKERHLRLGTNQLIEIKKVTGKSVTEAAENPDFEDLRAIFYVALKWEDKTLTEEQTGDIMDEVMSKRGFEYLAEKLAEAMENTFGNMPIPSQKQ